LRVSRAGVGAEDSFAVRNGTETVYIRDKYLELRSQHASDYATYKRIQLERIGLLPGRADILLDLGRRAIESGTLDESNQYFDQAVSLMERNATHFLKTAPPDRRAEVSLRLENTVADIRALQKVLPHYFSNRDQLAIAEQDVKGEMRYVVKERKTGKIVQVIGRGSVNEH